MKKYLLFAFGQYYPRGGLRDLVGSFDTLEEAAAVASEPEITRNFAGEEYVQIFDRDLPDGSDPVWELNPGDNT